jgi:hypothetical protein
MDTKNENVYQGVNHGEDLEYERYLELEKFVAKVFPDLEKRFLKLMKNYKKSLH